MNNYLAGLRNFDWRAALTRDLTAKLGAGVLAIMLWLMVVSQTSAELQLEVMIDYVNVPAELALAEGTQDVVKVRVKGSNQAVSALNAATIPHLQIDISGKRLGASSEQLTTGQFDAVFQRGITVQGDPPPLNIVLEPRREAQVPVKVLPLGLPAEGYVVGELRSIPATVRIAGPESLIRSLQNVPTEGISVEGVSENLTRTVAVRPDNRRLLLLDTASVVVTVQITPEMINKTLTDVPVTLRNAPATGVRVNPDRVTIEVRGPRDIVDGMGPTSVTCYIDATRPDFLISPELKVDCPERVSTVSIDPLTVRVER